MREDIALSMLSSIELSEPFKRPISVVSSAATRRWLVSPAATIAAVRSTSRRGRRAEVMVSQMAKPLSVNKKNPKPVPIAEYWASSLALVMSGSAITSEPLTVVSGVATIRQLPKSRNPLFELTSISKGRPSVAMTASRVKAFRFGTAFLAFAEETKPIKREPRLSRKAM